MVDGGWGNGGTILSLRTALQTINIRLTHCTPPHVDIDYFVLVAFIDIVACFKDSVLVINRNTVLKGNVLACSG